ncbi:4-hydroxy-tetrahydrodipicolinate reductase [Gammaproteobacteria bacterium]|nr:4-hydroxy-tetrahydrodipicolinate reductase [Gammaproteobacteria bacterium]
MTNIYINGLSGKMGSSICDLSTNDETISIVNDDIKNADVVIDFSRPDSSLKVLNQCIHYKKPLLIGTTGFNENQIKTIQEAAKEIPILLSFNMSKGIFTLKKSIKDFLSSNEHILECVIEEVHHKNKVDSPSGTAIELQTLIQDNNLSNNVTSINIKSERTLDVFGIHKVVFFNNSENIEFKHEALSRKVFANGAIKIAKLILNNEPKLYSTEDFFNTK